MHKPYLFGVVLPLLLAFGCSSSSDQGSGALDPAAQDFCLEWANQVCRMAYLCVDAGAQDAAFHARYGQSMDNCWQSVEKYCTSNQGGSQAFGPSCGPGKKLNQDLADACTQSLDAATCQVWTAAPAGACNTVCGSASNPNGAGGAGTGAGGRAGGGSSASTGGTGAGGGSAGGMSVGGTGTGAGGSNTSTGPVATPKDFCLAEGSTQCDRLFECEPEVAALLGTLADCKASTVSDCASGDFCPNGYDAAKAASCVSATKTATCEALMGDPPPDCLTACP